jgi:hypothetical protein
MNAILLALALVSAPDGSVIFWQDSALVRPIERKTGSRLTHAAVILDGYVYESVIEAGVQKTPLEDYQGPKRGTWFIMVPNTPYTNVAAMKAYAESQLGRPYSLRGWRRGREVRGIFCSDYAGNILARGGLSTGGVTESPGSLYQKLESIYTRQQ